MLSKVCFTTTFFIVPLRGKENSCIFAVRSLSYDNHNCQLNNCKLTTDLGMYGFDSKMNCHVSMSSLAVTLVNLDCKKVIGENNYALAA